jgi:hypothetical protein
VEYSGKLKKCQFDDFFLLRLFAPLPKHRLTEAGKLATVRTGSESESLKTIWMQGEGYAGLYRRDVCFVSALFDIFRYLKRYVGGLVVSTIWPTHIGLLGFSLRDVGPMM